MKGSKELTHQKYVALFQQTLFYFLLKVLETFREKCTMFTDSEAANAHSRSRKLPREKYRLVLLVASLVTIVFLLPHGRFPGQEDDSYASRSSSMAAVRPTWPTRSQAPHPLHDRLPPHLPAPSHLGRKLNHIPDLPPTEIVNTCGALSARSRCGVLHTDTEPIDSVVTVTFDATPATKVEAVVKAMMQPSSSEESAYFTFLGEQNAEFRYATNATSCAEGHVSSRAFEMDVVYTYVNDNAASYQAMKASRGLRFTASRTRDWNELLYSLRTVFHRGIGAGLVRKVHIVVADQDQVPQWLNASDPRINIVLHSQIFPADEPDALPTFNSHAIESVLHRIPGLSRFFVYFNNDMLWGRRVSFFDYFRPISAERQRHREERLRRMGCGGVVPADDETRVTVMFEPIFYGENLENPDECVLQEKGSHPEMPVLADAKCAECQLRPSYFFDIACRQRIHRDEWRYFSNYNKQMMFARLPGYWPTHSFAHIPRMMDRALVTLMQERDFLDLARHTRSSRVRRVEDMWTTNNYQFYAHHHRLAVDSEWANREWRASMATNPTSLEDLNPLFSRTFLEMPLAMQFRDGFEADATLREKLQHHFVVLDRRPGMYHFCLLKSYHTIRNYINELQMEMKLFVTLNDDITHEAFVAPLLQQILDVIAGSANSKTPFEV